MDKNEVVFKKQAALSPFEFRLFKSLLQLEQSEGLKSARILLNLQISGGHDSMCLLNSFATIFSSRLCKFNNTYILVAQHFNHKKRGEDSDDDMFFVAASCLKHGIPLYISTLAETFVGNFQNSARDWRKKQAQELSLRLARDLKIDKSLIVTAHHARDHVETVLFHILRGCGLDGLKGLTRYDKSENYFRPFSTIPYKDLQDYCVTAGVEFREDSSNREDGYTRNYIRHHILPHFEKIQANYENSFVSLSNKVCQWEDLLSKSTAVEDTKSRQLTISPVTSSLDVLNFLKSMDIYDVSENGLKNILHESMLMRASGIEGSFKEIKIKNDRLIILEKTQNAIFIYLK